MERPEKIAAFFNTHVKEQHSTANKTEKRPNPSLFLALVKAFGLPFAVAGFLKLIYDLLSFVGPQVLKLVAFVSSKILWYNYRLLIQYTDNRDEPVWKGYFYAVLLFVSAILQSLVLHHHIHRCLVVGMHLKTAVISVVYNKVTAVQKITTFSKESREVHNCPSYNYNTHIIITLVSCPLPTSVLSLCNLSKIS